MVDIVKLRQGLTSNRFIIQNYSFSFIINGSFYDHGETIRKLSENIFVLLKEEIHTFAK